MAQGIHVMHKKIIIPSSGVYVNGEGKILPKRPGSS